MYGGKLRACGAQTKVKRHGMISTCLHGWKQNSLYMTRKTDLPRVRGFAAGVRPGERWIPITGGPLFTGICSNGSAEN